MEDKQLRNRINKIRDAMTIITNEINLIYNENAEKEETTEEQKQQEKELEEIGNTIIGEQH